MTVLVKNTAQVMGCDKFSFLIFAFIQIVAYNVEPKDQTCINTERNTQDAARPHSSGLSQHLLSSVAQDCLASVLLAASWKCNWQHGVSQELCVFILYIVSQANLCCSS
jgi:hypothetical protein